MRLAEEEKLRKEMSAKKAKEEAERKHQVSRGLGEPPWSAGWLQDSPPSQPLVTCPATLLPLIRRCLCLGALRACLSCHWARQVAPSLRAG